MMDPIRGYQPNVQDFNFPVQTGENLKTNQLTNVSITKEKSADITLFTTEGDKVTISSTSQMNTGYTTYNGQGFMSGQTSLVKAESFYFDKQYELEISVEGDLNKQELRDIRQALRKIEKLTRDFFSGRIRRAMAGAAKIMKLGSISSLDATLRYEKSVSIQQETNVTIGFPVPAQTPRIPPTEHSDTPLETAPTVSETTKDRQPLSDAVTPEGLTPTTTEPTEETAITKEDTSPAHAASIRVQIAYIAQMTAKMEIGNNTTAPEEETPFAAEPTEETPITEEAVSVHAAMVGKKAAPVSEPAEEIVITEGPKTTEEVSAPVFKPTDAMEPADEPVLQIQLEKLVHSMTEVAYASNVEPSKMAEHADRFLDRLIAKFSREARMDRPNLKLARSIQKGFMKRMKHAFDARENHNSARITQQDEDEKKTYRSEEGSQGRDYHTGKRRHHHSHRLVS